MLIAAAGAKVNNLLTSSPHINRLKCINNIRLERAVSESKFLQRKNGRAAAAAVIVNSFNGLPQARFIWGAV
jgi:hypothetical protein